MMETSEPGERESKGAHVEDIPHEVLEFIFSFVPPYRDLQSCMCVSKRWYGCAQNVKRNTDLKLLKAITDFKVHWKHEILHDSMPTITNRFSHAACICDNSMYIFGGCTVNTTSFNDLWRFDLSMRKWVRPVATGTYPVPKAYASMVAHNDMLIVFGGYTCPSPSPFYQNITMFNDVHFYYIRENRWKLVYTNNIGPPPTAGHSACILNNEMIVFGGLISIMENQVVCTNDVWVLNLETLRWRKQETIGNQPFPRYAQSLVLLDDERFMLIGGSQTYHNRFVYSDCWTLTTRGHVWVWNEVTIKNKEWGAANIWCNPACRVGDKLVCLSRCKFDWNSAKPLVTSAVRLSVPREEASVEERLQQNMRRPLDRDQNINGRRGVLPRQHVHNPQPDNVVNDAQMEVHNMQRQINLIHAARLSVQQQMAEGNGPQVEGRIAIPLQNVVDINNHQEMEVAVNNEPQNVNNQQNMGAVGNEPQNDNNQQNMGAGNEPQNVNNQQNVGAVGNEPQNVNNQQNVGAVGNEPQNVGVVNNEALNDNSRLRAAGASNEPAPGPSNGRLTIGMRGNGISLRNSRFFNTRIRQLNEANKYRMAAFACDPPLLVPDQRHAPNRMDQLQLPEPPSSPPRVKKFRRNTLTVHVLDITSTLNNTSNEVSWLCPRLGQMAGAPEELVMYSLIPGNGELLMFGGVHNDINIRNDTTSNKNLYSNTMHCLTFSRDII